VFCFQRLGSHPTCWRYINKSIIIIIIILYFCSKKNTNTSKRILNANTKDIFKMYFKYKMQMRILKTYFKYVYLKYYPAL